MKEQMLCFQFVAKGVNTGHARLNGAGVNYILYHFTMLMYRHRFDKKVVRHAESIVERIVLGDRA